MKTPQEITEQKITQQARRLFLLSTTAHRYLFVIVFVCLLTVLLFFIPPESSSFHHISRCRLHSSSHSGVTCYLIISNYDENERKLSFSYFLSFCIDENREWANGGGKVGLKRSVSQQWKIFVKERRQKTRCDVEETYRIIKP